MFDKFLDWLFPSRVRQRERQIAWEQSCVEFNKRFHTAVHAMADKGIRWLNGEFNEFKTLENAMLSVEPGASGSLYACAEHEVKRRRLLERDPLKQNQPTSE